MTKTKSPTPRFWNSLFVQLNNHGVKNSLSTLASARGSDTYSTRHFNDLQYRLKLSISSLTLITLSTLSAMTPSHAQDQAPQAASSTSADVPNAIEENGETTQNDATTPALQTTPITRPDVDKEATRQKLFESDLEQKAVYKIQSDDEQFIALWTQAKGANQLGAILLLHDEGSNPDWPGSIGPLRKSFPEFGWSTLSISLPDPLGTAVPERPPAPSFTPVPQENTESEDVAEDTNQDVSKNNTEEDTEQENAQQKSEAQTNEDTDLTAKPTPSPTPDIEKLAERRIAAGIAFLHKKGHYNIVVIGEGLGAIRAAKYLQADAKNKTLVGTQQQGAISVIDRSIRALVLLNTRQFMPHSTQSITDFLNISKLPLLDIYTSHPLHNSQYLADRRRAARGANMTMYYQVESQLFDAAVFHEENHLTRRIRGFMNKHAKGVEIDK